MKTRYLLAFSLILVSLLALGLALPAQASPPAQGYATPTAGPDGRIIYIVQEGDNCGEISLKTGVPEQTLRELNRNLDENCTVVVGQQLLLGIGGPAAYTPTPGPTSIPTIAPPTPTPFTGTTEVCVLLYLDINGDALREETEPGLANGAVSLTNVNGSYSNTGVTTDQVDPDTLEPVPTCFADVPEGEYNVSMAIPDGYNPTVDLSYRLIVKAGDRARVNFGAQSTEETLPEDPQAAEQTGNGGGGGSTPILGILGVLLLLGGGGLGWYAWRMRQPKSKLSSKSPLIKK
jgi:hypothetical protein